MTVPGASGNIPERDWGLSGFDGDQQVPAADFAAGLTRLPYLSAALRRRARLWITTAVIGLLLGAAFSVLKPAPFQASTSVLLTHPLGDDPVEAMQTDVALADSRAVAGLVVQRLGLTENATSFLSSYTVVPLTDRILQITVKAPTSDDAVRRAESVAFQFLAFRAGQLQTQQKQVAADLRAKIAGDRQHIAQMQARITELQAAGGDITALKAKFDQASSTLTGLEKAATDYNDSAPLATSAIIAGSKVLDSASPIAHSRFKRPVLYAVAGMIGGLLVGLVIVVIMALVSDRLRRRDDVARALGAPVGLSVGPLRAGGRLRRKGLAAAQSPDFQRVVSYLQGTAGTAPGGEEGAVSPALAVIAVDNDPIAALAATALAVSCAREGRKVLLADLCPGRPAARLLRARDPGVHEVAVDGVTLTVAIPARDDIAPAGPRLGDQREPADEALASAWDRADLLVTVATLDPAVGGHFLAGWAAQAVPVITTGESSSTRVNAVGEMIRSAGVGLVPAVLTGADRTDESLGYGPDETPGGAGRGAAGS
jgi:capsular polysaccharide biosynthesis protein